MAYSSTAASASSISSAAASGNAQSARAFHRFRPTSHFIAPHSWSNDPCGAVYIPETREYLFCYQWNPGTTDGGNSAWGMARSRNLVTWEDATPALQNGRHTSYDAKGVFSGSIVSRMVEGKRTLFLFYTSVAALPIHWSKEYLDGCESQSLAMSTDFGRSWHRYDQNPLLSVPPKLSRTTGWRDPFVSRWESASALLSRDPDTAYMLIASGEKDRGCQLHLYSSDNLFEWEPVSMILDVVDGSSISPTSDVKFAKNFECASFFKMGGKDYLMAGIEEDAASSRHNGHLTVWLGGALKLVRGSLQFQITSHGILDHGQLYAPHIFRDAEDRLLQLGWADESAERSVVKEQNWAGCLTHTRELYQISRPLDSLRGDADAWDVDERSGTMTTLGIRPAPQLKQLRPEHSITSLERFGTLQSTNFELLATFKNLSGSEKIRINVRQSPDASETTAIVVDLQQNIIKVDRSRSSLANLGANNADFGSFHLGSNDALSLRIYVDESMIEVFANDRFAISSRIYPSLESSRGVSYDFSDVPFTNVDIQCWSELLSAWPKRQSKEQGGSSMTTTSSKRHSAELLPLTAPSSLSSGSFVYV